MLFIKHNLNKPVQKCLVSFTVMLNILNFTQLTAPRNVWTGTSPHPHHKPNQSNWLTRYNFRYPAGSSVFGPFCCKLAPLERKQHADTDQRRARLLHLVLIQPGHIQSVNQSETVVVVLCCVVLVALAPPLVRLCLHLVVSKCWLVTY